MTSSTTDRRLGLTGGIAFKAPVACATTANITLSGEQTIDGVSTSSSRVLVKNQTSGVDNGIYTSDTGAWTRTLDFDGTNDAVQGTLVYVNSGNANGSQVFSLTTASPSIGTTALTFSLVSTTTLTNLSASSGASLVGFIQAGAGALARTVQDKERDIVNAADFTGADLGAKINAADSALGSSPGMIYVKDGNATITTQIVLQNPDRTLRFGTGTYTQNISATGGSNSLRVKADRVKVCGSSKVGSILKNGVLSQDTLILICTGTYLGATTITNNAEVCDLTLDGNQANITHPATDSYGNGVQGEFCANSTFHDLIIKNVVFQGAVFQGSGDGTCVNDRIYNCDISACGEIGAGLEGGTHYSSIDNNFVHDLITVAEVAGGALGITITNAGQTGRNCSANNNTLNSIPANGIVIQDGSDYAAVIGNSFRNIGTTAGGAIRVDSVTTSPNHVSVIGNKIAAGCDKNNYAISILNSSAAVGFANVIGNSIFDCNGGAIIVNSGKNCAVSGNVISSVGGGGGSATNGVQLAGTANPSCCDNAASAVTGTAFNVAASTTNAFVQGNNPFANGTDYADAGTETIADFPITYTPTWTASGGNPSLGNGAITGTYITAGKQVTVTVKVTIGTTTTTGTGAWQFSLPFASLSGPESFGSVNMVDAGVTNYTGVSRVASNSSIMDGFVNNNATQISAAVPFTFGNADTATFTCTYFRT